MSINDKLYRDKTDKLKVQVNANDDMGLKPFNLDDTTRDLGEEENDGPRVPRSKQLSKIAGKAVAKSIWETSKDTGPGILLGDDFQKDVSTNKDILEHTMNEIRGAKKEMLNGLARVLPSRLGKYLKQEYDRRDSVGVTRSERREREDEINRETTRIFDRQSEKKETEEIQADKTIKIDNLVSTKLMTSSIMNMNKNISTLTGYFLDVGTQYYKKSLNLQFRTLHTQIDILKTMSSYYLTFSRQFDGILKNTSLPEYVKITNTERMGDSVKSNLGRRVTDKVFDNNAYIQALKENISKKFENFKQDIRSKSDTGEMVKETISSLQDSGLNIKDEAMNEIAETGGGLMGKWGTRIGLKKLRDKYGEKIDNNKIVKGARNAMSFMARDTSTALGTAIDSTRRIGNELAQKEGLASMIGGKGFRTLSGLLELGSLPGRDNTIKKEEIGDFSAVAVFDLNVYRNITEGIPKYLAKILEVNEKMFEAYTHVNGDKLQGLESNVKNLVYNLQDRGLTTIGKYRRSVKESIDRTNRSTKDYDKVGRGLLKNASILLKRGKMSTLEDLNKVTDGKAEDIVGDYIKHFTMKDPKSANFETLFTNALDPSKRSVDLAEYVESNPDLIGIISAINRSTSLKIPKERTLKSTFDDKLMEVNSSFPTDVVVALFRTVNILSGNTKEPPLPLKYAEAYASSFSTYMFKTKRTISANVEAINSAFSFTNPDIYAESELTIMNFLRNFNLIMVNGDYTAKTAVIKAVGAMNSAIAEKAFLGVGSTDNKMEMFRDIDNINREILGERGEVSSDILIGGKIEGLTQEQENNYVSSASVQSMLVSVTGKINRRSTVGDAFEKMDDQLRNVKILAGQAVDKVLVRGGETKKSITSITNRIKEMTKENLKRFNNLLTSIVETTSSITEGDAQRGIILLSDKINTTATVIDDIIRYENEFIKDKIDNLSIAYGKDHIKYTIQKNKIVREHEANIQILKFLQEELFKLKNNLAEMNTENFSSTDDFLKSLKIEMEAIISTLEELRGNL